jgi:dihydropteroate synthase
MIWYLRKKSIDFTDVPVIMGIVNVTPDSFFDGGKFFSPDAAVEQALRLIDEGVGIVDLGAESSRPGADPVTAGEEKKRLLPVIERLRRETDIPVSVDTYKPEVARLALEAGADIINDISGGGTGDEMLKLAAEKDVPIILMHMRGKPKSMQENVAYGDAVSEIKEYLGKRAERAENLGVKQFAVDPGIGFGKNLEHNLQIMAAIEEFSFAGKVPVLLGASRKSFIGHLLGRKKEERLAASLAVAAWAALKKVDIIRVHDVRQTADVVTVIRELKLR